VVENHLSDVPGPESNHAYFGHESPFFKLSLRSASNSLEILAVVDFVAQAHEIFIVPLGCRPQSRDRMNDPGIRVWVKNRITIYLFRTAW
jgi:hypothetical protein